MNGWAGGGLSPVSAYAEVEQGSGKGNLMSVDRGEAGVSVAMR